MDLILRRLDFTPSRTIGGLYFDGLWECWTLEDCVRDPGVKIPKQTAIPYGRYRLVITDSARFKEPLPLLLDVPMFEGIRIHAGNTANDTEGCVLVGRGRAANAIMQSRVALAALMVKLRSELEHEEVWLTVVSDNNTV